MEKVELVQVRFTLHLRDQRSMWMQDGCKVYMDSYMASNGSYFMVIWTYFSKPPLGGRPNTKPRDYDTPNAHNRWFILFYHVWGLDHIWLHTTLEDPWPHYTILEVCWDGLWTLSFGLSQFHGQDSWFVWEVALRHIHLQRNNPSHRLVLPNEWGVPIVRYKVAGWFWKILNEVEMFRKGF